MKPFSILLCTLALGLCAAQADMFSDYANVTSTLTNDLFIFERPGVNDFSVQAQYMAAAIGALRTNSPLTASNLVNGPIPNSLLVNVTATFVSSTGTNFGGFTRDFTNTLGTNLWVQMTNATSTAVFNRLGTNVIPATVNPTAFPLSWGMWLTNLTGGGLWFTP